MNAICLVCGTEFVVKHSSAGKYCSQACFHEANKGSEHKKRTPKKVCPTCGKEFYPKIRQNRKTYDDKYERDGTVIVGLTYPTIDHVVPLSKGGLHAWSNVRLACKDCNSKKSDAVLYPAPL